MLTHDEENKFYRPANSDEGYWFMSQWCDVCARDALYRDTQDGEDGCDILAKTLYLKPTDPNYPTEWIIENDEPICKAFIKEDDPLVNKEEKFMRELGQPELLDV